MHKRLVGLLHQVVYKNHLDFKSFLYHCFLLGVSAAAALHLAILVHKKTITSWYSVLHLRNIQVIMVDMGCSVTVVYIKSLYVLQLLAFLLTDICMAVFVWYLFYAAYYKIRKWNWYL